VSFRFFTGLAKGRTTLGSGSLAKSLQRDISREHSKVVSSQLWCWPMLAGDLIKGGVQVVGIRENRAHLKRAWERLSRALANIEKKEKGEKKGAVVSCESNESKGNRGSVHSRKHARRMGGNLE